MKVFSTLDNQMFQDYVRRTADQNNGLLWLRKMHDAHDIFSMGMFMKRVAGDKELADNILKSFLEQNRHRIDELARVITQGNSIAVQEYAHAIKGSAMTISARSMAGACQQLEKAGKNGSVELFQDLGQRIEYEFQRLSAKLEMELQAM